MSVVIAPVDAASDNVLQTVRGTVGYQESSTAPFTRIFGRYVVNDNNIAVTQAASNGELVLADSSVVALGQNTQIQVGTISQAASAASPTTLTLVAGAIRFAIKHPQGGQSNYRFTTTTSQIAVRGTVGLYATGPDGDVVTCLDCAAGDVTVSAGGNTAALLTGQTATITTAGVISVGVTAAAAAAATGGSSSFAGSGLNVTNSGAAFGPGVGTATATAATTTAIAAGAAAAAAGAGIAISNAAATPMPTPASIPVPINASSVRRAAPASVTTTPGVTPIATPAAIAPFPVSPHEGIHGRP